MADKKISEVTPKAAQLQDDDLLIISDYNGATYDTKSVTGANIRPFTTIMFNLSQTGTSAPTNNWSYEAEVTQTFTFARVNTGVYSITASSALFTSNKTFVTVNKGINTTCLIGAKVVSTTVIYIYANDSTTAASTDSIIDNAHLKINIIK
jgi:hypothetical protein